MSRYISGFSELIIQYSDYRKASGKRVAERTGQNLNIEYFDRYCGKNYPGQPLSQEMVDSWCRKRETETNTSCNARTGGIRSFIRYLKERGLTEVEPPPPLKDCGSTYIPHAFNKDELERFFRECDVVASRRPEMKYRMKEIACPVFFRLLYSSGIRTTEARCLGREDVDLVHGVLNIRKSKGNGQHYVALHESMTQLLAEYDRAAEKLRPGRKYFFETPNGRCYSRQWVTGMFRSLWEKANGTGSNAVAYALRHNYAVTNINSWPEDPSGFNARLHYLSKSMGHSSIESTLHYYSIVPRLADILLEKTEKGMDAILPEVPYEEE